MYTLLTTIFYSDLRERSTLDLHLSRALGVALENGRLTLIDESDYVLTLDYTIKMLSIHERYVCVHHTSINILAPWLPWPQVIITHSSP